MDCSSLSVRAKEERLAGKPGRIARPLSLYLRWIWGKTPQNLEKENQDQGFSVIEMPYKTKIQLLEETVQTSAIGKFLRLDNSNNLVKEKAKELLPFSTSS